MPDPQSAEGSGRPRAIPSEHRVFSLVLALVASPQGLTKRDVLKAVYGYSVQYESGKGLASLERQFERDKEQLRDLGIPVDTIDAPLESGNNQLTRYRIDKHRLEMPTDVRFTPRELALLRLAAVAWSEGSLTAESRRSVMKLEALGAGLDVQHIGIAPSIGISSPVAPVLQRAITEASSVSFAYQLPQRESPLQRHVIPLRLHRAERRWHLIGYDLDRGAERVFLLSRIVGRVTVEAPQRKATTDRGAYDYAELRNESLGRVDTVIEELDALQSKQRATVMVREGSQAAARLSTRSAVPADPSTAPEERSEVAPPRKGAGSSAEIEIGTLDYRELAVELAGFGEQVTVLEPQELREDVIDRLRAVREQHSSSGSERSGRRH